jgi:hypothetical protein
LGAFHRPELETQKLPEKAVEQNPATFACIAP